MNALFRSLFALFFLVGIAPAASAQGTRPKPKPKVVVNPDIVKDGLMMKGGRVIVTELGIVTPLTADKKLVNGTTISPAGLITAPDGTTTQMAEGDMVSLTGRVKRRAEMAEADSLLKIKQYDLKFPGKREKMAKAQAEKDKAKAERDKAKAKAAAEKAKQRAKAKK